MHWLEVSLTVNGELAEAVADVLARFAYSGVMMEQGVKYTDEEDAGTPTGPITVRAYLEMNDQIEGTRQKLEESLYYLGRIQPLPAASYKQIADACVEYLFYRHAAIHTGKNEGLRELALHSLMHHGGIVFWGQVVMLVVVVAFF